MFPLSIYPSSISRCQHIKVNGTQCGSPALKGRRLCFFHNRWRETRIEFCLSGAPVRAITSIDLPVLEDANSVQVALMQVLRLILARQLDPKTAGLLLYGLQTASLNLSHTRFEPTQRDVVIEPRHVADNCLGDHAWHPSDFEEHDDSAEEAEEGAMQALTANTEQPPAPPTQASGSVPESAPPLADLLSLLAKLETTQ
ncbi:MAG: hypothetical protein WB952_03490 [Terriglobales bacterium]